METTKTTLYSKSEKTITNNIALLRYIVNEGRKKKRKVQIEKLKWRVILVVGVSWLATDSPLPHPHPSHLHWTHSLVVSWDQSLLHYSKLKRSKLNPMPETHPSSGISCDHRVLVQLQNSCNTHCTYEATVHYQLNPYLHSYLLVSFDLGRPVYGGSTCDHQEHGRKRKLSHRRSIWTAVLNGLHDDLLSFVAGFEIKYGCRLRGSHLGSCFEVRLMENQYEVPLIEMLIFV